MNCFVRISLIFCNIVLLSCASIKTPLPPLIDANYPVGSLYGAWYIYDPTKAADFKDKPSFELNEINLFLDIANILCLFAKARSEDGVENLSAIINMWQPQNLANCPKFTFFPTKNGIDVRKTGQLDQYPIFKIDFLDLKDEVTLPNKRRGRLYALYVEVEMGWSSAGFMSSQHNQQPLKISRIPAVVVTVK